MNINSRWRKAAREIIGRVMKETPRFHDKKLELREVIFALNMAYPFEDRSGYPYKMWMLERKIALRDRFPGLIKKRPKHPFDGVLHYELRPREDLIRFTLKCPWCGTGGCPHCVHLRPHAEKVMKDPLFLELSRATRAGDVAANAAMYDWLRDQSQLGVGENSEA